MKRELPVFIVLLWAATAATAQDASGIRAANLVDADLNLVANHDPEIAQASFELLPGFEVNLFASEPMLANPVQMVWDSRGRLWVACSWAYPQLKPGAVANDKIIILEDTNGDGTADTSTVFAEGLYIPTGIELANGGCYVAQAPDLFFFKDTDGDNVADVKQLALTGFGIEDSHHSISAFRRGPGGWIYFQEGIFLHSQVETQYGVVRNYNGGVYQYNPRTQELRVFARTNVGNPWGHVFDRWGQSFLVDNPRIGYLPPTTGNSGEKVKLALLTSTEKQCGGDMASGSHLPEELHGQLLTCRFKSRAVVRYEFLAEGAGFSAHVLEPILKSRHPNFRPVDCKMGPDGAIYVADWYNTIINHGQHDFRDPRRLDERGRIWRITVKGRPLVEKPGLAGAPIPELVAYLRSPEDWVRHQARLELSERDAGEVASELERWMGNLDRADSDYDHHLVEAMWACQNVERPSEAILARVLRAKDGQARAAGARVIRYWHAHLSDPISMVAQAAGDSFARVRMEAILSAGFIPQAGAFSAALRALDYEADPLINSALAQTTKALGPYWRPALAEGKLEFARAEHRSFARREAGIGFEKRLADFLAKETHGRREIAEIKAQLVAERNAVHLGQVIAALTTRRRPAAREFMLALLDALHQVGREGGVVLEATLVPLQRHLDHKDESIAAATASVLGVWNVTEAGPDLAALLRDGERSDEVRMAAAMALSDLGLPRFVDAMRDLAATGDVSSRYVAVRGLIDADLEDAAKAAAILLSEMPGNADPTGLVKAFLQRENGATSLAQALVGNAPHPAVAATLSDYHRRTGQLPPFLVEQFRLSPSPSLSAALLKENRPSLISDVENQGDPARGERVFRRPAAACAACHAIGPAGPTIGPNLVAVGAAAETSYVVEAILEPNKSIAEQYETTLITTRDGWVRMGVIATRSEREIVIHDSTNEGREVRIPVASIRETRTMPSLMPAGLVDQMQSRQEFLDLAKFVSLLGRPGPYANDESPVIRKWQIAAATRADSPPANDASWTSAYSYVNGELPVPELVSADWVHARGYLNVQVAGPVRLKVNTLDGLRLWIEGREISNLSAPIEFSRGRKALTFSVDQSQRGETGLRVELAPTSESQARFQPEGGI